MKKVEKNLIEVLNYQESCKSKIKRDFEEYIKRTILKIMTRRKKSYSLKMETEIIEIVFVITNNFIDLFCLTEKEFAKLIESIINCWLIKKVVEKETTKKNCL